MMAMIVLLATTAIVVGVCLYLTLHPDYYCGVIGALGMAMIAFAAATRFSLLLERCLEISCEARFGPVAIVWLGLALYLGRVAWRFYGRTKLKGRRGWYEHNGASR